MNRLEKIALYRENEDAKTAATIKANEAESEVLKKHISKLKPRISELIETANCCLNNNIGIDARSKYQSRDYDSWEKGTFIANGISHRVGFFNTLNGVTGIGIINGGVCGNISFFTDGESVFGIDESDRRKQTEPRNSDMKRFLDVFDEFERSFYAYVDNIVGGVVPVSEDSVTEDFSVNETENDNCDNNDTIYVVVNIIDREHYTIGTTKDPCEASEILKDDFLREFLDSDYTEEDFESKERKGEDWDLSATEAYINDGLKGHYDWFILEIHPNETESE